MQEVLKRHARGTEVQTVTSPTQTPSSLPVVQPAPTNEAVETETRQYNCCIIRKGNGAEHACPYKLATPPLDYLAVG